MSGMLGWSALLLAVQFGGCATERPSPTLIPSKPSSLGSPMATDDSAKAPQPSACPAALLAARRGGSDPDRYIVPTDADRAAFGDLVAELLGPTPDRLRVDAQARTLGYQLEAVPEIAGAVLLRELPGQRRGGGAYLFRAHPRTAGVVQAPHTFFDEGTLALSCELFERAQASALFIDTAHRYKAAQIDERGAYPADVARAPDSLFQAATEGALRADPKRAFIQLHGFAPRESGAAVVLSEGTTRPLASVPSRVRELLVPIVSGAVERFPDESNELGATTNVQGTSVRAAGGRFLHVEMSAALRKALLADGELRARVLDVLAYSFELQ